jgi:pimeloyl-ACP methyl ester carboxylesterase
MTTLQYKLGNVWKAHSKSRGRVIILKSSVRSLTMRISPVSLAACTCILSGATHAFVSHQQPVSFARSSLHRRHAVAVSTYADTVLVNPDMTGITEEACLDTAARMQRTAVPVSPYIHPDGKVGISYVYWPAKGRRSKLPPVVLVHGFDSSCLEYRRLGKRLGERGIDTYAVDLLGWGFTQLEGVTSFSADAKVEALRSFLDTVVPGKSFVLGGASLGGAAAIEAAAAAINDETSSKTCEGLILIDAQGFVDGIGPMAVMPTPIARLGVQLLKSNPLRSSANQMSYYDKETYATDEAVVVGRIHCLRDGWSEALVSFMQSGGFTPSSKVPTIRAPSLIVWGRQDGILDGVEFAPKFLESLPDARLQWIEECGHVPHLEQPDETADAILDFLKNTVLVEVANGLALDYRAGLAAVGVGAATIAGVISSNILPFH